MNHVREFKDISGRDCVQVLVAGVNGAIYHIGSETDEEVAAYYRKREDERLGRESFEVDGELFYVYFHEDHYLHVQVVSASSGRGIYNAGDQLIDHPPTLCHVAYNMWFEAHNPPKEPQEGEIWDIETVSGDQWRCVVRDGCFVSVNPISAPSYAIDDEYIVRKEFVL